MFERISRSWELAKASAAVLRDDKALLVLPIVSVICTIVVTVAFIVPAVLTGLLGEAAQEAKTGPEAKEAMSAAIYAWLFAFYLVQYFVILFFNTALVGAALMWLDGGNPTLGTAIGIAMSRIGSIAGYTVIAATVGVLLRFIGERFGAVGRIIESLIGAAWSVATFLVVPIIAARGIGPIDAVKQSAALLRKSWGENIIGTAGIGLLFALTFIPIALIGFGLASLLVRDAGTALLGVVVLALTIIALGIIAVYAAALGGVYSAAVYRYADGRPAPRGFDQALLATAFRPKAR